MKMLNSSLGDTHPGQLQQQGSPSYPMPASSWITGTDSINDDLIYGFMDVQSQTDGSFQTAEGHLNTNT